MTYFLYTYRMIFGQLSQYIAAFAGEWYPNELSVVALSTNENGNAVTKALQPTTTVDNFLLVIKRPLLAVSAQWFNQYIISHMGTIHGCYILE